jgi:hypothetical protein
LINANYLVGNSADSGSGGGLRFQNINGTDVINFPNAAPVDRRGIPVPVGWPTVANHPAVPAFQANTPWNAIEVTNNIIANNVAGWDGAGVSLLDALNVNIVNNTIASNNTTASSGVLFQTLFAPLASTDGTNCTNQPGTQSCPQPSGLVSVNNSAVFSANLPASITCPAGHGGGTGTTGVVNGTCRTYSTPELYNDLFWQNRSVIIGVGGNAGGLQNQQNMITVYDPGFTGTGLNPTQLTQNQVSTGDCKNGPFSYWDLGVRGNTGPGNHTGGQLAPFYSVLTNSGTLDEGKLGTNNQYPGSTSPVTSTYCNGSRVPPESGGSNWQVPPGTNESNALPAPPFTLAAGGTVDEGNNWINLSWGPLATSMPDATTPYALDAHLPTGSPAIDKVALNTAEAAAAPTDDFYGNPRKQGTNPVDIGAVEFVAPNYPIVAVTPTSLTFPSTLVGSTTTAQTLTLSNTGGASFMGINVVVTAPFSRPNGAAGGNCGNTLAANATCTINVVFTPAAAGPASGTATITGNATTVTGSPVALSGTGAAAVRSFSVTPNPLAFGNVFSGSNVTLGLTIMNTGNVSLSTPTFTALTTPLSHPNGNPGGDCGNTLAVGASCTYNVRYAPTNTNSVSQTLTIGYTGATSVSVPITGKGTATRGTIAIAPFSITLPAGSLTGTGLVTVTNSSASGTGTAVGITNTAVNGGSLMSQGWLFNAVAGQDGCSGTTLLPQQTCTVGVRFTTVNRSATVRNGTISVTDNATGSPQSGGLQGNAP